MSFLKTALEYSDFEISLFKSYSGLIVEEKGELLQLKSRVAIEGRFMVEEIFNEILNSQEGHYIIQVQVLADMKPSGW